MGGNFGYELDINKITSEEKEEIKKQVKFYKEIRQIYQFGDLYRLKILLTEMMQLGCIYQKINRKVL